jgi:SpoIID/LytB domain protein
LSDVSVQLNSEVTIGSRRRRSLVTRLITLLGTCTVVAASWVAIVAPAPPAAAYPSTDVTLTGHGFGHGRGMGQWGAFGYAYGGWTWQQIVQHFYSGAAPAPMSPQQEGTWTSVALTENDGNDLIVTSGVGFTVAGTHAGPGQYVLIHAVGGGLWDLYLGSSCGGPWSPTAFATGVSNPVATPDQDSVLGVTSPTSAAAMALQLCQLPTNLSMRGNLEATTDGSGSPRSVNFLPVEDYVAGVVPNESPAYWGTLGSAGPQGQAWGFQELEAQSVAARSYMAAARGGYGGYADTCDLSCQTYRGLANESPLTDAATIDTLGYVMEVGANGVPLTTEYSASTGGYSAPGNFPAVPDDGDGVCPPGVNGACNPNHDWKVSVPVATIESAWPQLGALQSVSITARNGYGEWGGRVTSMSLVGSAQTVVVTGDQFAAAGNLLSDWFTVTNTLPSPAVAMAAVPDGTGYWVNGSDGSVAAFGSASYFGSTLGQSLAAPVVGLAATPSAHGYWEVAADGGIFAFGDAAFFGSTGAIRLNRPVVGMASTPSGNGYWLVAADGGIFSYGDAPFFGSTGAIRLNQPIVGMAATRDGGGYWLVAADGGIFAFGDAAFYGSMGAHALNRPVVGMAATPDGGGYWLVASDGGIFAFGDAPFRGSAGATPLVRPIVGMARSSDGGGYWLVAADGGIFSYGDAAFYGSAAG